MSEFINKLLLAGDKLMFEANFRQPRFTHSGCRPILKTKREYKKIKKIDEDSTYT